MAGVVQFTITEGNTSKVFYIAQALLQSRAPTFFRTVIPSGPNEHTAIKPNDVEIEIFANFVKWLRTEMNHHHHPIFFSGTNTVFTVVKSYIFCHNYSIVQLCDHTFRQLSTYMTAVQKQLRLSPAAHFVQWVAPEVLT